MTWRRLLTLGIAMPLSGCAWLPEPASEQAVEIEQLWQPYTLVAAIVAAIVLGLLVIILVRDRRDPDDDSLPSQNAYNIPIEIAYLVVPALALGWLVTGALETQSVVEVDDTEPDVVVEVVAFRWQWEFTYAGQDVVVDSADGAIPELVLPAPATIEFSGTSRDVIHSLWVPDFLFKRDMVPGRVNTFRVTTLEPGEHHGACAEFCGVDHSQMSFTVRTVPPDEYETWLAQQREVDS